jgi:predicted Zn-dependent protease
MPPLLKASFLAKIAQPSLQADDRASVLWAAQVLMLHQPEQVGLVTERLRWWVTEHARDAAAWALLAKAWALDQQPLKALRAEAESRAAQFDWAGAVDRLRSAQDWMRQHPSADLIEQSIIDARYRELQQRLQEDLREQREAR